MHLHMIESAMLHNISTAIWRYCSMHSVSSGALNLQASHDGCCIPKNRRCHPTPADEVRGFVVYAGGCTKADLRQ